MKTTGTKTQITAVDDLGESESFIHALLGDFIVTSVPDVANPPNKQNTPSLIHLRPGSIHQQDEEHHDKENKCIFKERTY